MTQYCAVQRYEKSLQCGDDCQGTWDTVVLAHRGKEDILYVHVW